MWRPADLVRFASISVPERRRLVRAMLRLLWIDLGVRLYGFARLSNHLERRREPPRSGHGETSRPVAEVLGDWVRAVDVAARHHLYPMRCVPRSLALRAFLAEEGIATELRIGVRKEGERLAAHAWIEHRGTPIGESPTVGKRFAPLARTEGGEEAKAARGAFC